jgi:hypothetical protein
VIVLPNHAAADLIFPHQTRQPDREGRQVIGSTLIGQNFTSNKYFSTEPPEGSDEDNPGARCRRQLSSGSNLGPTNQALIDPVHWTLRRGGSTRSRSAYPDLHFQAAGGRYGRLGAGGAARLPRICNGLGLCLWQGIFAALAALFRRYKFGAFALTAWNESAAFIAIALLARFANAVIL